MTFRFLVIFAHDYPYRDCVINCTGFGSYVNSVSDPNETFQLSFNRNGWFEITSDVRAGEEVVTEYCDSLRVS